MPEYKFQFKTGHLYDGSTEIAVKDFVAKIKEVSAKEAAAIEAKGGQLVNEPVKPKKRETKPVKWIEKEEVSK